MRKHLKRTLAAFALSVPYATFAQANNFTREIKAIVNDYMIPIFVIGLILAAAAGFVYNLDEFVDKKGEGTRSKALQNIGWIVGIAFVSILGIIAIINYVSENQITIK